MSRNEVFPPKKKKPTNGGRCGEKTVGGDSEDVGRTNTDI
jgi:hypothetical protein